MITLNNVLYRIKLTLGIGRGVPTSFTDNELIEYLRNVTLPDYSRYFKNEVKFNAFKFSPGDRVPNSRGMYLIPKQYLDALHQQGITIDGVKEMKVAKFVEQDNNIGVMFDPYPGALGNEDMFGGMAMGAANHYRSRELWTFSKRAWYRAPHIIEFEHDFIDPEGYTYDVTLWVTHPASTATIPDTYLDSFLKLATLDIKTLLWNNELRALEGTETGRGSIKVPQWGDAERERAELIEEYKKDMIMEEVIMINVAE